MRNGSINTLFSPRAAIGKLSPPDKRSAIGHSTVCHQSKTPASTGDHTLCRVTLTRTRLCYNIVTFLDNIQTQTAMGQVRRSIIFFRQR
ncbi:hypothetical protein KCP78_03145 [Salmonella enterica subsp. enterica]|nr:hypothetical protein KCP78_03145 [Salmonella enterica subsp. enterica]